MISASKALFLCEKIWAGKSGSICRERGALVPWNSVNHNAGNAVKIARGDEKFALHAIIFK